MARILMVDDDADLRLTVGDWLEEESHEVDMASDGIEGLTKMTTGGYDLVLLDWEMPGLSGPDVCEKYRNAGGTAAVLMLTGKSAVADKVQGLKCGADDYLTKPFHLDELALRIFALLRRAGMTAAAAKPSPEHVTPAAAPDLMNLPAGYVFAERYAVISQRGAGGMSVVYKAKQRHLNRIVAIKIMQTRFSGSDLSLKRFQQEAQIVCRLKHENIVEVLDFGFVNSQTAYFAMEYLVGKSVAEIILESGCFAPSRAVQIMKQVAAGLDYAQGHGILHRDIKSSNIMCLETETGEEKVKIIDFGVAKILVDDDEQSQDKEKLTLTGECFGTSFYMSPEQCAGEDLDFRSDIYALGCLLYEMLTGLPPFIGKNTLATMQLHMRSAPIPPSELRRDLEIPPVLEAMALKALEKERGKRYQSAAELLEELNNCGF